MGKYWWTVWIKVAVLAAVLLGAYLYVKDYVTDLFEPYLLEEPAVTEPTDVNAEPTDETEEANIVEELVGKVEDAFDVRINYEDMIFDYANGYAKQMMEDSRAERNVIEAPLSWTNRPGKGCCRLAVPFFALRRERRLAAPIG